MYEDQSYKVTEIDEAGLGIVSTRRIIRGEIILQEKPLVLVESEIKGNDYTWEEKTAYLRAKVSSLKKKDREKFYSLHDCKQEKGHKKSASGIFRTNNFALGALDTSPDHGVFCLCSRLNHSCSPNCEVHWSSPQGTQTLVATRDIDSGSELTICYLGLQDRMTPADNRRFLLLKYGFTCECQACNEELADSKAGDYIQRYLKLKQRLQSVETGAEEEINRIHLDIEELLKQNNGKIIWRIQNLEAALVQTINKKENILLKLGKIKLILNI